MLAAETKHLDDGQLYGDGWYDGFLLAVELAGKYHVLTKYDEDSAAHLTEQAKHERAQRVPSEPEGLNQLFGEGYHDGFVAAIALAKKGHDLTDYDEDYAMLHSEKAEDERSKRLQQNKAA